LEILRSCLYVDDVFTEESLDLKREYILRYRADVLVMGDDWAGKFDEFSDICEVHYLPRTENISSTLIKERVKFPL
jgi:glycerol-3-phosphate cytidylyltransferase-like family protein